MHNNSLAREEKDHRVVSDMQRFQQVLLNLQSNALKFSQSGDFVHIKAYYISAKKLILTEFDYFEKFLIIDQISSETDREFVESNENLHKKMFEAGEKSKIVI